MSAWLKKNWGFAIFLVDLFASLLMIALKPVTGHYINYTEPARYLWRAEDPYEITFPGSPGAYFHSPGCALYFYGLFTLLPGRLGQFLYVAISAAIFCWGLALVLKLLAEKNVFNIKHSPYRHLVWLMAGSEVIGGIVAVKIDVLVVGVTLLLMRALAVNRMAFFASVAMGIVTSFKLHPLIAIGLMGISLSFLSLKRSLLAGAGALLGLAIGFLSPALVLPWDKFVAFHLHWREALKKFIEEAWLHNIFQHLFGFLARGCGILVPLETANRITLVVGCLLAIASAIWGRRLAKSERGATLALLYSLGSASAFVVMFSHLIQSNSYIIYFPLVLAVVSAATVEDLPVKRVSIILAISYFIISVAYSDLVPRPVYRALYDAGVKPLGVLFLGVSVFIQAWKVAFGRRHVGALQSQGA